MKNILLIWFALGLIINAQSEDSEEDRRRIYQYFEGREIYQSQCFQCHGNNGKGDGEWAEGWTENRPRNFRTGAFKI